MKSFRQYISEAGIRRKMRKLEGVRKKYQKAIENPNASEEELDTLDDAETDAMQAVNREQKVRSPRIIKKSVELSSGNDPEERLKNAANIASEMQDAELPWPLRHRKKRNKRI
jgi:hypothetical protein